MTKRGNIMTTTANNSESKVLVNGIGFSGWFYKFLREEIKIGNQILYPGSYEFDYLIKLDDVSKNGHLTFSFTGSIKIKKNNGRYYDYISGAIGDIISHFKPELSMFEKLHLCNHLGQPTYIDDIRCHINEAYNIDNDYKFSEFSFELKESSEFSGNYFYRFNNVLKCLDDWNGNLYFNETKLSFGTKIVDICFCVGAYDINKYFNKYSIVTIKPDKLTKIEIDAISEQSNNNVSLDNCGKQKETPKEGDYVEFNLSCNVDAPIYTGLVTNDPGLGLVCVVDGQKIEVRKMVNLKVLKPKEGKTVSPIQSEKESSLNDKERGETKQIERDNSIQPKGTKPTMQYTDDMLELVSLDLNSMTYVVNGDIGTAKNIQSIVLYDEIGKIVVSCDDGKKIECQFDGESILQSVLKEM